MYKLSGLFKVSSKKNTQKLRRPDIIENAINGDMFLLLQKSIKGGIKIVVDMPKAVLKPFPIDLI